MGWPRRPVAATIVLVVALGASACRAGGSSGPASATDVVLPSGTANAPGSPASPAASSSAPAATPTTTGGDAVAPVRLRAVATESTLFNTQRTFRLELHNDGDRTVDVDGLRLVSPLFEEVAETRRSFAVDPDDTVLVPLAFGPSRCGDERAASPVPGLLVVSVHGRALDLELEDRPVGLLAARRERECAVAAVRDAVDIGFGPGWERLAPRRATGEVVVTAGAEVSATVADLQGNIVFGLETTAPTPAELPLATLGPGAPEARIPVTVSADRCDVHALIESKTTFVFTVAVTLDGGESVVVPFEPDGPARDLVEQLLQACLD